MVVDCVRREGWESHAEVQVLMLYWVWASKQRDAFVALITKDTLLHSPFHAGCVAGQSRGTGKGSAVTWEPMFFSMVRTRSRARSIWREAL